MTRAECRKHLSFLAVCVIALSTLALPHSVFAQQMGSATTTVNVRTDTTGKGKIVGTLKAGTEVEVVEQSGDYSKVKLANGKTGYLRSRYLKLAPAPVAEAPAPAPAVVPETPPPAPPVAAAPAPAPAPAPAAATAESGVTQLETVEVTGSRIRSLSADSPSPIQVVTSADIQKSGVVNIQELLLKMPEMGTPTFSRTNSNFNNTGSGVATIDLRNMGIDRTLVLVNGRRFVSGIPGSQAVDLNTIPTDFIDRVEVYTGGASAVYGSDAMAGVVNIILKHHVDGLVLDMQEGESKKKDDKTGLINLTGGVTTPDGKGDLLMHLGYSSQGLVRGGTREPTDNIPLAFLTGDPADMFTMQTPFYSSFNPQGTIITSGGSRTFDANDNIIAVDTNGANTGSPTGFNRQAWRTLAVPTERYLFASSGEYRFAEAHSAFLEGTYASTRTIATLEPFPLDSADATSGGLYPATGVGPAEFNYAGGTYANPLIPASLLAMMTDTNGDGLRDYSFKKRLAEFGARGATTDRNTFRLLTGVKGELPIETWRYELFTSYAFTGENGITDGQYNVMNFRNAMEAVPDVTDVNGNGDTTEAICMDAQARAQGCVPADIFGFNKMSAAAIKYIEAPSLLNTFTRERMVGGSVNGDALTLPAGPLGVAAGGEYREEYSRSTFDALGQTGLNGNNALPETVGQFDVKEAFVEFRVPLVSEMPLVKMLTATAAVRTGDYSTVGNVLSYTGGVEWTVVPEWRTRATVARATRAPNISELYAAPSQDFPSVNDPCEGVASTDTGTLAANCNAAPGVATNQAANGGVFTLNQADLQGTSAFVTGNPKLNEEVGKTWTAGIVWQPSGIDFLKDTSFEVDFYQVQIDDAIIITPYQFTLQQCYVASDPGSCALIVRRPNNVGGNSAGSLQLVNATEKNSGGLKTDGLDMTVDWANAVGPGRLSSQLRYSHIFNGYTIPVPGSDPDYFAGEMGGARDRAALTIGYKTGPWSVRTLTTYIAKSALDDQLLIAFGAPVGSITVPAKTYFDLQVGFEWRAMTFYVGADNLFDVHPPRLDTNALIAGSSNTGSGTDSGTYDAIGQRYYAGLRFSL